jgi:hypothetical protein
MSESFRQELLRKINVLDARLSDLEQVEYQASHVIPRNVDVFAEYTHLVQQLPALRGYWPLNILSSTTWRDTSGHGADLSQHGSPLHVGYSTSKIAMFYNWTKVGSLYAADSAHFDISGTESNVYASMRGISMGALVQIENNASTSYMGIIAKYISAATGRSYLLYWNGSTQRFTFLVSNDGTNTTAFTPAVSYNDNEWYHITWDYNTQQRWHKVTINGTLYENDAWSAGVTSIYNGNAQFEIGAYNTGSSTNRWGGNIAHAWLSACSVDQHRDWSEDLWNAVKEADLPGFADTS